MNSTLDAGLRFGAQTCAVNPDTGVNECAVTPVEGTYADGVLTWLLPIADAPGEHTVSIELCSGAADFERNATECTTVELDPITVAGETEPTDTGTDDPTG